MADDIDIEEHDVLENPVIRMIFPDITEIKKEINYYFEDGVTIKQDPDTSTIKKNRSVPFDIELKAEKDANIDTNVPKNVSKNIDTGFQRPKLVLGSKPNINAEIPKDTGNVKKISASNNYLEREQVLKTNLQSSKIILGSKPAQRQTYSDKNLETTNSPVQIPNVMLQDIGTHLYQSKIYCKECKTLFPHSHDFNEHKQNLHVTTPSTNNSNTMNTRKNRLKIRIQLLEEKRSKYTHKCPICGSRFGTLFRLSQHHRNIHEKKVSLTKAKNIKNIHKCSICESSFTDRNNLNRHIRIFHKKVTTPSLHNSDHRKKCKKNDNRSNRIETTLYKSKFKITPNKCSICNSYFSCIFNLKRHYKNIHNKRVSFLLQAKHKDRKNTLKTSTRNNKSIREMDNMDTLKSCFHCNETFPSQESLIEHIYLILGLNKASNIQEEINKKENKEPETLHLENRRLDTDNKCTLNKLEPISSKNKLIFESNDLDEISSITPKMEQIENENTTEKDVLREKEDCITLDQKEGASTTTYDDEFVGADSHPSVSVVANLRFRNKRKYETSELNNTESKSTKKRAMGVSNSETNTDKLSSTVMEKEAVILEFNQKYTEIEPKNPNAKALKSVIRGKRDNTEFNQKNTKLKPETSSAETLQSVIEKEEGNIEFKPNKCRMNQKTCNAITLRNDYYNKKTILKDNRIITNSKNKSVKLTDEIDGVYECVYCTFILPTLRTYWAHIIEKHKVVNISKGLKVKFEKRCKYCPSKTKTIAARNMHVSRCHHDLLTKTFFDESEAQEWKEGLPKLLHSEFKKVKSFVLESIVYKCSICDVNFLSSCVAKDHQKHLDLLLNWTCSICKNVFKKYDKDLHLKQHRYSKTITVCEFNETELSRLLYNCTKCAIHFTEERYLKHFPKCGIQMADSVYCKKCDILIDKCKFPSHEDLHKIGNNTEDFIVMTGKLIIASKEQEKDKKQDKVPTRWRQYEQKKYLTFCNSCKCYLSDKAVGRIAHVMGTCSQIVKYTCDKCGLVFTNKSINTHREHHRKQKDLKLQDYKFFDLKGIQIRPPIPSYHKCNNCDIVFVHRNDTKTHICSQMEFKICEICNIKFTESAFKLHMNFHTYLMSKGKESQTLGVSTKINKHHNMHLDIDNNVKFHTDESDDSLAKTYQKHDSKQDEDIKVTHDSNVTTGQKITQEQATYNKLKNIKPATDPNCKVLPKTDEFVADTAPLKTKTDSFIETIVAKTKKDFEPENEHIDKNLLKSEAESKQVNDVIYTCQSCEISITKYDKVIEHCQKHYNPTLKTTTDSTVCKTCSLKFEAHYYDKHQELHHTNSEKTNDVFLLRFDPTYFTADKTIWTQHVLASLTPSKQNEILEKSKYPPECRLKMDIIQRGPNHLTVYKCNRCGNFIDPDLVIVHLKDTCHRKSRKYPCSICGLPINSSEYRTKHEEIHKRYSNVRLKSYNIAVINCTAYKTFNETMINSIGKYVLYQCRVCDGIVDKEQRQEHQCNVNDLQECDNCGLRLYKKDYNQHISKHTELNLYRVENMKVILFGRNENLTQLKERITKFNGTVCDFKLFKCESCEVCVNNEKGVTRHTCVIDDSKWKCPKCSFYICSRSIKQHIKLHDLEADFKTENMEIIPFTNEKSKVDVTKPIINKGLLESEKHETESMELGNNVNNPIDDNTQVKETAVLYKCACGLHFVKETSAKNHAKQCPPKMKIVKQNCTKCNLLFTPKELFTHIIVHHSDKNKIVNYDVTELPNTKST